MLHVCLVLAARELVLPDSSCLKYKNSKFGESSSSGHNWVEGN
ncbi:hypothetical protein Hanom_Chr11g00971771 [Helianthus anomalus]